MGEMVKDAGLPAERQQQYEEFLKLTRRNLSDGTSTSTNKVLVKNSASLVGLADARAHVLIENQTDGRSTFFSQSAEGQISATQFGTQTVRIDEKAHEPELYHLAGRVGTPMVRRAMKFLLSDNGAGSFDITDAGVAAFKKDCEANQRTFILSKEKEKYEGEHYASILEVYERGEIRDRFWIDSSRGYICPKVQILTVNASNGAVVIHDEIKSENFVLDEHSQKWFPTKVVRVSGNVHDEKAGKPVQSLEINVVPGTLVLNQPIPDSIFTIAVPQGQRVDDFRRNDVKMTFLADEPGKKIE